jgi:UDP-N-acetylglucosamine transferase subunit ALG13
VLKNIPDTGSRQKKVLVAPLDWGLGHTTRSIPLIRSLVQRGCEVFLAGNEQQKCLFQGEFPQLSFLPLRGYGIKYGASAVQTAALLLRQVPQMGAAIRFEHRWLAQMMKRYRFHAVVSDNRYGLYHPAAHCTIVTHQLCIQVPVGGGLLQRLHYSLLQQFNECWVPDVPAAPGLAGALSHPRRHPNMPVRFIGPLSRFEKREGSAHEAGVLLLLSGPEPQRTLFENMLLPQLAGLDGPVVLVRGLPGSSSVLPPMPGVQVYNHLPANELDGVLRQAAFVVCRSGYSSVMDLAALGKQSILVPTPGQSEQAYLARHLQQSGFALAQRQQGFDLQAALKKAALFSCRFPERGSTSLLAPALDAWEERIGAT